jgi:endonuclease YncB( thermonuclease family)
MHRQCQINFAGCSEFVVLRAGIDAPEKGQAFGTKSRENRHGLWVDEDPAPPWEWRKAKRKHSTAR